MYIVWATPSVPISTLDGYRTTELAGADCLIVDEVHLPFIMYLSTEASANSQTAVVWVLGFLVSSWVWILKLQIYHFPKCYSLVSVSTSYLPTLVDCRRAESPLTSCSLLSIHQRHPFWQKDWKASQAFRYWVGEGLYPKCSGHIVGMNLVINSARKVYKSSTNKSCEPKNKWRNHFDRYLKFSTT